MDRAEVRIVAGGDSGAEVPGSPQAEAAQAEEGASQQAGAPSQVGGQLREAPIVEDEPTIGGAEGPKAPSEDVIVRETGGSIADQMRARFNAIQSTEEFPVPGWELDDGSPGLILVARTFADRKAFVKGVSNEVFIAKSTHKLLFVDDRGTRNEIDGGWGPNLARLMGIQTQRAADLVSMVISKPDPDDEQRRIPNVAGIAALAQSILNWAGTGVRQAEEELGE